MNKQEKKEAKKNLEGMKVFYSKMKDRLNRKAIDKLEKEIYLSSTFRFNSL